MGESLGRGTRKECSGSQEEAVDQAFRCYADPLYGFCLRWTHNPALAEEVRQRVFLEAWRRRNEIDLTRPLGPWLYGVARNVLLNEQRRQRSENTARQNLEYTHRRYAEDPSEEFERRQQAAALVSSLTSLPDAQRQVVSLCLLEERSYEAAAHALQIPVGTVRSRLSRARLSLALAVRAAAGI